jgi:hypothetical protein
MYYDINKNESNKYSYNPDRNNPDSYLPLKILSIVCTHHLHNFNYCYDCKTTSSLVWRRGAQGMKTLCNKCGIKYYRNLQKLKRTKNKYTLAHHL